MPVETGKFSLIGPGRAGLSLAGALVDLGWVHVATFGRGDRVAGAAAEVDLCVIATPDGAVAEVSAALGSTDAVVMHLSGALPLSVLEQSKAAGMHPLVSLADSRAGVDQLRSAWFAVAGDVLSQQLAQDLSGQWFPIRDEDRAIYHAAAVVASNHLVALLGQVQRIADVAGVPFEAYLSLVQSSIDNVVALGPADALTGPAARGDEATIAAHIAALESRMPDEVESYRAMVAEARRLGGLDPQAH